MSNFVTFRVRTRSKIDYGKAKEKQLAIPDQSLSLREIISRFTRGVPVDTTQRNPIWIDQDEFDYEALARSEFSEKMSIAEELRAKYDAQMKAIEERKEAKRLSDERSRIRAEIEAEATQKEPGEGSIA